jgi:hypothetical protein
MCCNSCNKWKDKMHILAQLQEVTVSNHCMAFYISQVVPFKLSENNERLGRPHTCLAWEWVRLPSLQ